MLDISFVGQHYNNPYDNLEQIVSDMETPTGVKALMNFDDKLTNVLRASHIQHKNVERYKNIIDETGELPAIILAANGGTGPTVDFLKILKASHNPPIAVLMKDEYGKYRLDELTPGSLNSKHYFIPEDMVDLGHTLKRINALLGDDKATHLAPLTRKYSKPEALSDAEMDIINQNVVIFPNIWILSSFYLNSGWFNPKDESNRIDKEIAARICVSERLCGITLVPESSDYDYQKSVVKSAPYRYLDFLLGNSIPVPSDLRELMVKLELTTDPDLKLPIVRNIIQISTEVEL